MYHSRAFVLLFAIGYAAVAAAAEDVSQSGTVKLDGQQRGEITTDAIQTIHAYLEKQKPLTPTDNIPEELWPKSIRAIKPLEVRNDHLNIKIIMKTEKDEEEGFYVSNPISSYAPKATDFLQWKRLSGPDDKSYIGGIYYFKEKIPAPSIPKLSTKEQIALVQATMKTVHAFTAEKHPDVALIPEENWAEAIRNLKPLRVRYNRLNLEIVLRDAGAEEGLFVMNPISSVSGPSKDDYLTLTRLSDPANPETGGIYYFKQKKPKE